MRVPPEWSPRDWLALVIADRRAFLDALDDAILELVEARAALVARLAADKREAGIELHDPAREDAIAERLAARATRLSPDRARPFPRALLLACRPASGS